MPFALQLAFLVGTPAGQFYLADPGAQVPILPAIGVPRAAGGWLPPPGPPSANFIRVALANLNRQPGDVIVSHTSCREEVGTVRVFRSVGGDRFRARLWRITYCCQVFGPDGPYTVYTDRTALVRVP